MSGQESKAVTDWENLADNAKSRSKVYSLLSAVFREEPGEILINELKSPRLSGVLSDMKVDLGAKFYTDSVAEVVEALGLEFTRLFIGPESHISAHESIFVESDSGAGGLWGKKTVAVKSFIETTGLDYKDEFTGIPDHISVELEFMQKLSSWEAEKWLNEERKEAEYCLMVQKKFIEEHLLQWVPELCDRVIAKASLPFYKEFAKVTKEFLLFDHELIKDFS